MPKSRRIPITAAKNIAKDYKKDQVIILAWDREVGDTWVTTYGTTQADCEQAALGGNEIKKLLGWPKEQTEAKPARQKRKESEIRAKLIEEIKEGLSKLDKDNYIGLNTIAERDIIEYLTKLV